MAEQQLEIKPQAGPQETFLSCDADFVVFGGAAGGGKTWALLLEDLRHLDNPKFGSVTFRRTFTQIDQEGGLWQKSIEIYPLVGAKPNVSKHRWTFPKGSRAGFAHAATRKDVYNYQGGEIALLKFDEITHFKEDEVFYLISRNRSTSGVKAYIRATCNPDPDSWLASFLDWWIAEDGYAIKERSGVVRWFARSEDGFLWADTKEELLELHPQIDPEQPMSFSFILSRLKDNKKLLESDPSYRSKLLNLPKVEREKLLGDEDRGGNWKIREAKGLYFKQQYFEIINSLPTELCFTRAWDFAGTKPNTSNRDPDWTIGLRGGKAKDGTLYLDDMVFIREEPGPTERLYQKTVIRDGKEIRQLIPQDPGEAGKKVAQHRMTLDGLQGHSVRPIRRTGSKEVNAEPASAYAEKGLIKIKRAHWNKFFFQQVEEFPEGNHDDIVDCLSDLVNHAPKYTTGTARAEAV